MSDDFFLKYRIEHTLHGCFHIFDSLVNDSVQTQIYTFLLCDCFCSCIRSYIEPDNDRIGCRSQSYVRLIDCTYTTVNDLNNYFFIRQFHKTLFYCLNRTLNIGLNNDIQLFQITFLNLIKQVIQRHFSFCLFQKTVFIFRNKGSCKVLCFFIIFCSHQNFSCIRHIGKSQDLNRSRWTCFFYTTSLIIHHSTYFTGTCTCCDKISHMQSTFLNQNRSNRSFSFVKLCLDNKTTGSSFWICFQFSYFCSQKNHFQKIFNTFLCLCRNRNKDRTSAPIFRNQFVFGQFLFYSLNICTWFINFINCNNDFNPCCFCMVDRLYCLRHNTIIGCNHKNSNICCIGTTHTHCSKCLMTRCIQECNLLPFNRYHVSTDMLCDTTSLTVCHICLTDCIQKRSFTMVNMTHNTYYRWSCNQCSFILFFFFQKFFNHIHFFFLFCDNIKVHGNFLGFFKINFMVNCNHDTLHKEFLNNHRRLHFHLICQFADCHFLWQYDFFHFLFFLFLRLRTNRFLKSLRKSLVWTTSLVRSV